MRNRVAFGWSIGNTGTPLGVTLGLDGRLWYMTTTNIKRFGIAVMIAALAGTVVAAEPNEEEAGLLRGPEVVESSGADAGDSMSGTGEATRRAGDLPFRAYLGAIRGLNKAAQDNPELALSDEQKVQIKEIVQSHKKKVAAFKEAHKKELEGMRKQRGQQGKQGQRDGEKAGEQKRGDGDRKAKGNGKHREGSNAGQLQRQRPDGELGEKKRAQQGERASPEKQQQMREQRRTQRREVMSKAPSDQAAKKKLWSVLTSEQQTAVKEKVAKMRVQRHERVDGAVKSKRSKVKNAEAGERKERRNKKQRRVTKQNQGSDDD